MDAPDSSRGDAGVFSLIVINVVIWVLDVTGIGGIERLYLNHADPSWYQFLSTAFCHGDWGHLSMNLFFVFVFGKLVAEREGTAGVVLSYVACAIGANVVVHLFSGGSGATIGASGAVYGLFAVSVLVRLSLALEAAPRDRDPGKLRDRPDARRGQAPGSGTTRSPTSPTWRVRWWEWS